MPTQSWDENILSGKTHYGEIPAGVEICELLNRSGSSTSISVNTRLRQILIMKTENFMCFELRVCLFCCRCVFHFDIFCIFSALTCDTLFTCLYRICILLPPDIFHIKYGTYQFLLLCTAFLCCHLVPEEEEEEEVKLENIHGQTIITKRWHSTQQLVHTQESINAPKTFNKCHVFNESWMEKSSAHVGSHRGDRKWIQCLIHFCFVTTDDLNSIVLQSLKL